MAAPFGAAATAFTYAYANQNEALGSLSSAVRSLDRPNNAIRGFICREYHIRPTVDFVALGAIRNRKALLRRGYAIGIDTNRKSPERVPYVPDRGSNIAVTIIDLQILYAVAFELIGIPGGILAHIGRYWSGQTDTSRSFSYAMRLPEAARSSGMSMIYSDNRNG